jgi:hypothetical protein
MTEYRYSMTEYDPERPWIVLGSSRGQVTLPDDDSFYERAHQHWPGPRWSVQLATWQLTPKRPGQEVAVVATDVHSVRPDASAPCRARDEHRDDARTQSPGIGDLAVLTRLTA